MEGGEINKSNVLFLCTGNSCRSILGEALMRHRHGAYFNAFSAGMSPKGIHPLTIQVLHEIGIDTTELRSKDASEYLGQLPVQHLIVVCDNANEPVRESGRG